MKIGCDVVGDLLPLYCEDLVSEDSRELVEQHCGECETCKNKLKDMREGNIVIDDEGNSLKKFMKEYTEKFNALLAVFVLVLFAICSVIHIKIVLFNTNSDLDGNLWFMYIVFLFPAMVFCCNLAWADYKSKLKYLFPFVSSLVGTFYYGIASYDDIRIEFSGLYFMILFVPAIIGLIIGLIRARYMFKPLRFFNEGMIAGIFLAIGGFFVFLMGGYLMLSGLLLMVVGIGTYKISTWAKNWW